MAKRISQLTELTSGQVASDDYLAIVDTSAGQTKKVKVSTLTGSPDFGWSATGESWSYSAWDSTIREGVITVPSDATTKYSKGMRIRISQATGGTKYGIITAVTSTTLRVLFKSGTTFTNEAISSPVYSPLYAPYGFSTDPDDWTLSVTDSTSRSVVPTSGVWNNVGGSNAQLAVGYGEWYLMYKVLLTGGRNGGGTASELATTLSTANNTASDEDQTHTDRFDVGGAGTFTETMTRTVLPKRITLSAKTTYYLNGYIGASTGSNLAFSNAGNGSVPNRMYIKAISAYI